jgi:microcystin-dependent protein
MSETYIGEIRLFAFTYAPEGWLDCAGQTVPISQYEVLFALIGTTYGGDGSSNFMLPDLRGRYMMSAGIGPGLTPRTLGINGGVETVTLTVNNLPSHAHALVGGSPPNPTVTAKIMCSSGTADNGTPANDTSAAASYARYANTVPNASMRANVIQASGRTDYSSNVNIPYPHENMPRFVTCRYSICYNGIFPQQS